MFDPYEYIGIDADDDNEIFKQIHHPESGFYTSSMISDILGLGYISRHKRWEKMVADGNQSEKEENRWTKQALEHGKQEEPYALYHFSLMYPEWVGIKPGMALLTPKIAACTDNLLLHKTTGEMALLEVKSPLSIKQFEIPQEVKPNWIAQVHIEMAAWRIYKAFLLIWQPEAMEETEQVYLFEVNFSQEIVDRIVKAITNFDEEYIQQRKEPPKRMSKDQKLQRDLWNTVVRIKT